MSTKQGLLLFLQILLEEKNILDSRVFIRQFFPQPCVEPSPWPILEQSYACSNLCFLLLGDKSHGDFLCWKKPWPLVLSFDCTLLRPVTLMRPSCLVMLFARPSVSAEESCRSATPKRGSSTELICDNGHNTCLLSPESTVA